MTMKSFLDGKVVLHAGDCREVLASLPDASIDAIVTDPPYGLGFMGKKWDTPGALVERKAATDNKWDHVGGNHNPSNSADAARTARVEGQRFGEWCETWAAECLRVLKPGGHIVAFSSTRTYHRMACAIEDASFEIRDQLAWVYGSGMPKGLNIGKAYEATVEALRVDLAGFEDKSGCEYDEAVEALLEAEHRLASLSGWNTTLKPSWEPICLARKPLMGTVLENMLRHGVGGINGDGCRVEACARPLRELDAKPTDSTVYVGRTGQGGLGKGLDGGSKAVGETDLGRWPANLVHDGSDEVLACFPESAGQQGDVKGTEPSRTGDENTVAYGKFGARSPAKARRDGEASAYRRYTENGATNFAATPGDRRSDGASAARFFYASKAGSFDRLGSKHPTVKPVDLMQWLVRLVCPSGGTVLDPFAGTGSTGEAAWREGMRAILIEREPEYQADIVRRMELATQPTKRSAVAKSKNKLDKAEDLPLFGGLPK